MNRRNKVFATLILLLSMGTQVSVANAYREISKTNDFGDKQFILETYFKSGVGAVPSKRPSGPHKQLGLACTEGFFEIGFFDIASSGDPLTIGTPTSIKVKFDGKLAPSLITVNTKKGTEYVQVSDAKALVKKLKSAKTFAVEIGLNSGFYRGSFDVAGLSKYVSKFAAAGCKI